MDLCTYNTPLFLEFFLLVNLGGSGKMLKYTYHSKGKTIIVHVIKHFFSQHYIFENIKFVKHDVFPSHSNNLL